MAPLPRYTPAGITIAAPQPVTAAAGQAAASLGRNISASLTQMSNFAFRQAMQQAVVEGAEYGADKAPTIEQIKRAQEDGDPVNVPGDTTTVFGRAARAQALSTMRLNVEAAARNELAQMHANILKTEVPADQYAAQMNNLIKGYGDAIASASPTAAGALRASLATIASMQYKVHATQLAAKAEARRKVAMVAAIDNIVQNSGNIVRGTIQENEAWYAAGQEWLGPPDETILASERNKILKLAYSIGDPKMAQAALKRFNDSVQTARVGVLADFVQDDDGTVNIRKYQQLRSGRVEGTSIESTYVAMDDAQRAAAFKEIVRRGKEANDLEDEANARLEKQRTVAVRRTRVDFMDAWGRNDTEKMKTNLDRLRVMGDSEKFAEYSKLMREGPPTSNGQVIGYLEMKLAEYSLTREEVLKRIVSGELSHKDARGYFEKIRVANDRSLQEAVKAYRTSLQLPTGILVANASQRKKQNKVEDVNNKLIIELQRVRRSGGTFDPMKIVNEAIKADANKTMSQSEREHAKRTAYSLLKARSSLGALAEMSTDDAIKRMDDPRELRALMSVLLKNRGGKTDTGTIKTQDLLKELIEDLEKKVNLKGAQQ